MRLGKAPLMLTPTLPLFTCLALGFAPQATEGDLARLMPHSSFAFLEAPGLSELCAKGLEHPLIARFLESPVGAFALQQAPIQPEAALAIAEQFIGEPLLPLLSSLSAGGAAIAIDLKHAGPVFSLAVRGNDEERLLTTIETVLDQFATQGKLSTAASTPRAIRGLDAWILNRELAFAIEGTTLLMSNDEGHLRDMIDRALDGGDKTNLLARETFTASARGDASSFAWGWVDLDVVDTTNPRALGDLRGMTTEPGAHFLLGSTFTFLGGAERVEARLALAGDALELKLRGHGVDPEIGAELRPAQDSAGAAVPKGLDGDVLSGALYRDLAGLFRVRSELFPARFQPDFAEATSTLALFFGGEDISDTVLPALDPWIGVVSRAAQFDANAMPDVPLPALALLVRIKDESVGPRLVSAFQTLIGVVNLESAQNMQPTLTLGLELAGEHTVTTARFSPPRKDEGVDIRHNLVPACCLVGDVFVLGSHVSLVRQVVDQVSRGELEPATTGENLRIAGPAVLDVVEANREALVMNGVLNEGKSMEQSRGDIGGLEAVLALIEGVSLDVKRLAATTHSATIHVQLK
ncbi:MAG: hypothetical protein GY711_21390 [bacterium]|nr:hypothetical protein [bacterium]